MNHLVALVRGDADPWLLQRVTLAYHDLFTDTDVAEGYRFILNSQEYRVEALILTLGEVQALCEAI